MAIKYFRVWVAIISFINKCPVLKSKAVKIKIS
jgi:hypothetical protein